MTKHRIVSRKDWIASRRALLEEEKRFTRERDAIAKKRMELPWVKVEESYEFQLPSGKATLAELFGDKSQLIVYHFMFSPDWTEGCKSCSLIAETFSPLIIHLQHRDVQLMAVSRAPIEQLEKYKQRMGWTFPWASSSDSKFNFDYDVSYTKEQEEKKEINYNFSKQSFFSSEGPGMSVFFKDTDGTIYHTYSMYARGLEEMMPIYRFLDIAPKGRDEEGLNYGMEWVRHRDKYDDNAYVDQWTEVKLELKK